MKSIKVFLFMSHSIFILFACGNERVESGKKIGGSFEFTNSGDTINSIDAEGNKQGHWIKTKMAVLSHTIITSVPGDSLKHKKVSFDPEYIRVEEGKYRDNKKEGYWKNYDSQGKLLDSVYYVNGEARNN